MVLHLNVKFIIQHKVKKKHAKKDKAIDLLEVLFHTSIFPTL